MPFNQFTNYKICCKTFVEPEVKFLRCTFNRKHAWTNCMCVKLNLLSHYDGALCNCRYNMTPVYLIPKQRWTKHYCQKSNLSIGSKNPINQSSHNIHQVYVLRANHAEQNVLCVFHCPLSDWKINLIKGCADTTKKSGLMFFFSTKFWT